VRKAFERLDRTVRVPLAKVFAEAILQANAAGGERW
jgi:hypothetical protein